MPKGKYKQYLRDPSIPVPRTTLYRMKKYESNKVLNNMEYHIANTTHSFIDKNTETSVALSPPILKINNSINNISIQVVDDFVNKDTRSIFVNNTAEEQDENDSIDEDTSLALSRVLESSSNEIEISTALLTIFFNGKVTQHAMNLFLKFASRISTVSLPRTFNGAINTLLSSINSSINYEKTWYCDVCFKKFDNLCHRFQRNCSKCQSRLSMYYSICVISQIRRIFNKNKDYLRSKRLGVFNGEYKDFNNGKLFRDICEKEDSFYFKNNKAFTFILNTDGIAVSNKSKLTIWPIYLIINELPIEKRFCIDNVIIAGVSVGDSKPDFSTYLNPIVSQLKTLEYGIDINESNKGIRFFLLAAVFDKPARASILNIVSCTGYYSCMKCMQKGENAEGGNTRIFRFISNDPIVAKRSDESYQEHVMLAESQKNTVFGIKGRTSLSFLKYFQPLRNTCIDYMHSVLEGVVKNFFKHWFGQEFYDQSFSLRKYMQEIDNRLLVIKPPSFVTTTPRSIYSWNEWRAHEYLHFILYYALPVFREILPYDLHNNLVKLNIFIEVILSRVIKESDLIIAHNIIVEFVKELEGLYVSNIMLSGVHELLHLEECIREFGPLNNINCFMFEELNRKFMSFIHGKDLIGEEFIKIFSVAQAMSSTQLCEPVNNSVKDFINENPCFLTSNSRNMNNNNSYKILSEKLSCNSEIFLSKFQKKFNVEVVEYKVFKKLTYNGILFTNFDTKTKHLDACFVNNECKYGIIESIFEYDNKVFVFAKQIAITYSPFFCTLFPNLKSSLLKCRISSNYFIEDISLIEKVALVNVSENECYVSKFRTSHLFYKLN